MTILLLKNKWSCTKLIGGGGVQKSFSYRTDPEGKAYFKKNKRNYMNLKQFRIINNDNAIYNTYFKFVILV